MNIKKQHFTQDYLWIVIIDLILELISWIKLDQACLNLLSVEHKKDTVQ